MQHDRKKKERRSRLDQKQEAAVAAAAAAAAQRSAAAAAASPGTEREKRGSSIHEPERRSVESRRTYRYMHAKKANGV